MRATPAQGNAKGASSCGLWVILFGLLLGACMVREGLAGVSPARRRGGGQDQGRLGGGGDTPAPAP